jgi:hypothetical protein
VAACFSTPTRPTENGGSDDSGVGTGDSGIKDGAGADAMVAIDGNPASCVSDDFVGSGSGTCGLSAWGNLSQGLGSGTAYLVGTGTGELTLSNYGGDGAFVLCNSKMTGWRRVIVDVRAVAATANGDRTFVGMQSADGTKHWGVEFSDGPVIESVCDSNQPPPKESTSWTNSQRFIKIERVGGADVTVSTSELGSTYNQIAVCTATTGDLDSAVAQLRAYKSTTTIQSSAFATFGSIELCN